MPTSDEIPIILWLFDSDNSASVGALGLIGTVLGFAITIIQLLRTESALRASEKATNALRARLSTATTANYVATLLPLVRATKRELDQGIWVAAAEEIRELRNVIVILHERQNHIDHFLRQALAPFASDFASYAKYLAAPPKGTIKPGKIGEITDRLSELSALSMKISDHLSEKTS